MAEFSVNGNAAGLDALADFVRALEQSPNFGVLFQNASADQDGSSYLYTLTVGAIAEVEP